MPTITLTLPTPGTLADAGVIASDLSIIQTLVNGGIDDANISPTANIQASKISGVSGIPAGTVVPYAGISLPSGYLLCDGSSQLRATYSALFAALTFSKGTFTVTIASPGVFTQTSHGLVVGDAVYLTTTGSLPTGLSQNTTYYVNVVVDANSFKLSTTRGGADINTSGSQSGTHTLVLAPYGVADSTHFYLPDTSGRALIGRAASGHADVKSLGADEGVALGSRRPKHKHTVAVGGANGDLIRGSGGASSSGSSGSPWLAGGSITVTVGPQTGSEPTDSEAYIVLNCIIKT